MWNLFMKRLEIIGYSRAIGSLQREQRVSKTVVESLIQQRDELRKELERAKVIRKRDPHKTYMRGAQNA